LSASGGGATAPSGPRLRRLSVNDEYNEEQ